VTCEEKRLTVLAVVRLQVCFNAEFAEDAEKKETVEEFRFKS
jgi:hypothetical protein